MTFTSLRAAMGDGVEPDLKTVHERVRRELWAAVYRQAHEQSAQRVRPQFCFTEDADKAVADFDRRFAAGVAPTDPVRAALQEMVDMMNSGDEHGAGSRWHQRAVAALAGVEGTPR